MMYFIEKIVKKSFVQITEKGNRLKDSFFFNSLICVYTYKCIIYIYIYIYMYIYIYIYVMHCTILGQTLTNGVRMVNQNAVLTS